MTLVGMINSHCHTCFALICHLLAQVSALQRGSNDFGTYLPHVVLGVCPCCPPIMRLCVGWNLLLQILHGDPS